MTDEVKMLSPDNQRTVWMHLCVKNNRGFFYSGAQKEHLLDAIEFAGAGPDSKIIQRQFPHATWYVKHSYNVPKTKITLQLMLVGDGVGVLAKLKLGKRKQMEVALDNGYVVTWERPVGLAMTDQAYALVKDAITHMTKAEKLLNATRTRETTLRNQLLLMARWKRRVDFLQDDGSKKIVVDADVSSLMTEYTDKVFARVIEMHNAKASLIAPLSQCELCAWIDRSIDRHMQQEAAATD